MASAFLPAVALAQIAGQNINMVTGTEFPNGDPFLQRQNEPSIAVSSANAQHLVAGANDYRSVDLPAPVLQESQRTGDAWLGVFKSFNGGQTWKSTLLRGYWQDTGWCANSANANDAMCSRPQAPTSALAQWAAACPSSNRSCPFQSAADPVVRAGTDGLVYYAGLAFDRNRRRSRVVVGRFMDFNDKEVPSADIDSAGDPLVYLGASTVDTGGLVDSTKPDGDVYFLDKPWIAIDVPRGGATTCTITDPNGRSARSIQAGAVYVAYVKFRKKTSSADGTLSDVNSQVMLSRSDNCGKDWSIPIALNDVTTSTMNEAPVIGIDPTTGKLYVVWRRVALAGTTQGDAILVARSFSRGSKFTKQRVIANIPAGFAFDHGIAAIDSYSQFRAWALPTFAISIGSGGNRHLHAAWSQRLEPGGDARVVLSTANVNPPPSTGQEIDENDTSADKWSAPLAVDDDDTAAGRTALVNGEGKALTFGRGHQVMPALTYSQGRLVLVYYDTRFDHTRTLFKPNETCDGNGCHFSPDSEGRFYTEIKAPMIRPAANIGNYNWDPLASVFSGPVDDRNVTNIRHTMDVRVAVARGGPTPVFASSQVSQYPMGQRGDERLLLVRNALDVPGYTGTQTPDTVTAGALEVVAPNAANAPEMKLLQQLRQNPPNLTIFSSGLKPFMGDYIDVQGPAFVRKGSGWDFNTDDTASPVFHAVWTTNQDVRKPATTKPLLDSSGNSVIDSSTGQPVQVPDWTKYTPVAVNCDSTGKCTSVFDPTKPISACNPGDEGSRDQNIYTSRITEGLLVFSPQNAKALNSTTYRTFAIVVQNSTWKPKNVRFTVTPISGVTASLQDPTLPVAITADAVVPARSHVSRTIFARLSGSSDPGASVTVQVDELVASCDVTKTPCALLSGGASGAVTLNPPGTSPSLLSGTAAESFDSLLVDTRLDPADPLYGPDGTGDEVASHDVASHDVASHDVASHDVASHDVASHDVAVLDNASHDVASHDVASHDVASHDVADLASASHDVASHDVASHDVASMSDVTYEYENKSSTAVTWDVLVAGSQPQRWDGATQQYVNVPVQVIITKTYRTPAVVNCALKQRPHAVALVNIPAARIFPLDTRYPLNPLDGSATRATVTAGIGDKIGVTLRFLGSLPEAARYAEALNVVAAPQNDPLSIVPPCTTVSCAYTIGDVVGWVGRTASGHPKDPSITSLSVEGTTATATVAPLGASSTAPTGTVTFMVWEGSKWVQIGAERLSTPRPQEVHSTASVAVPLDTTVSAYYAGDQNYLASDTLRGRDPVNVSVTTSGSYVVATVRPAGGYEGTPPVPTGVVAIRVNYGSGWTTVGTVTLSEQPPPNWDGLASGGIAYAPGPGAMLRADYLGDALYTAETTTSTPVFYNSTNGHSYQIVCDRTRDWFTAEMYTRGLSYGTQPAYLATISSTSEDAFVSSLLTTPRRICGDMAYYLGGYQTTTQAEPAGGWAWRTGEPFLYTNWAQGEPNNGAGGSNDENMLAYWWNNLPGTQPWNDVDQYVPLGGYVIEYGRWLDVTPMIAARFPPAVVATGAYVYAIGGDATGTVERYDAYSATWTAMPSLPVIPGTSIVQNGGTAAMDDGPPGRIWMFGGWDAVNRNALRTISVFTPTPNQLPQGYWTIIETTLPFGVAGAKAVTLAGQIYIIGGDDGSRRVLRFDPATQVITEVAPMIAQRSAFAAAAANGGIYVFGGQSGSALASTVEFYQPTNGTWTTVDGIQGTITAGSAVTSGDGKSIYLVGAWVPVAGPSSHLTQYDLTTGTTTPLENWPNTPQNGERQHFGTVLGLDGIYVIGGYLSVPGASTNLVWRYKLP